MEDAGNLVMDDDNGLSLDDFSGGNFVKNPMVGQTLVLAILKVKNNKNTKGKNTATGKEFDIGLKKKDGSVRRIDIDTDQGVYTLNNWEIFFKFFGKEGILTQYAKNHNKRFEGAKVSITRLLDGSHANYKIEDLAKIIGKTASEARAYQEEIKLAMKEQRLFTVSLA